jgi:UDP-N-acetylmuramoyl-tripeptide--D-alanyl-D-alanine ligase
MLELGPGTEAEHRAIGRLAAELGLAGVIAVGPGAAPIAQEAASTSGIQALMVDGVDAALAAVQQNVAAPDVVLVKASRSIGLERVAAGLLAVGTVNADAVDALSGRPERKDSA